MGQTLELKLAIKNDASELCQLINSAYRGEDGWTKETDFVSGERINVGDTESLIENPKSHLLVAKDRENIIGCVCVEKKENQTYISLLTVRPKYQNIGLGKQILRLAEDYSANQLSTNFLNMVVISQRDELIAFYERCGYIRTGKIEEYPVHLNVGIPKTEGLTIEYLTKST